MKTATLAATCLTLLIAAPNARADDRVYRALDDLAFDAMHEVREARWEIHDHFDTSRDFRALLEDADELTHALRDIQDAAYREDRPERLSRLIDAAQEALIHFQEHADHSDFALRDRGSIRFGGGGYSFRASSRHGGSVHVDELQRTLDRLDSSLHEMTEAMERAFGHHHGRSRTRPSDGRGPFFDGPALPEDVHGSDHGAPPSPTLVPGGPSAESVSFPLLGGRIRFRIN